MAKTTTKTEKANRDQFNSREGSISYQINEVIIRAKGKEVSAETIVEKSGATPARVTGHIKWLAARGRVVATDNGCKAVLPKAKTTKRRAKATT